MRDRTSSTPLSTRRRFARFGIIPVAVVVTGVLAACSSSTETTSASSTTGTASSAGTSVGTSAPTGTTPGTGPDASDSCVADADAVISSESTPASTEELPADLVADLDAAATSSFREAAAPGAIVGVRTPEGTWTKAYGEADPDKDVPMAVGMHTRIGSITKTFTGTAIMQLVEQDELSLDDTIDEYVPGVPNGDRITLRMLANMTSGVASYTASTDFTDTYFDKPETVFTPEKLLEVGVADSPIFEPGEKFNYSNTNTVLLGMVIEEVTGQPVEDVVQQQILEPLGLDDTSWPGDSPEMPEPYAQGFTLQGNATPDNPSNATNWNPSWTWTAGELISNMDDLLVYGRALSTGQGLLDAETQAERLASLPAPAGYGIAMGCIDGWVGHTGELPGYNTSLFHDTTTDTTVIVQTNSDIASGECPESPTLTDDPRTEVCSSPATRMFVALSTALGHPFTPNPQR